MAKYNIVEAAKPREKALQCEICGGTIKTGEPYKYIRRRKKPVPGRNKFFCQSCEPLLSHVTSALAEEVAYAVQLWLGRPANSGTATSKREHLERSLTVFDRVAPHIRSTAQKLEEDAGRKTAQSKALNQQANQHEAWNRKLTSHTRACDNSHEWAQEALQIVLGRPTMDAQI